MKAYVFERVTRESILAGSEEDARRQLTEFGYLEDEFELIDVRDER